MDESSDRDEVIEAYRDQAPTYDAAVRRFDVFARFGFTISGWGRDAVSPLGLRPGDPR